MRYCGNRGDYIEGEFFNITTVNYFEEAPKKRLHDCKFSCNDEPFPAKRSWRFLHYVVEGYCHKDICIVPSAGSSKYKTPQTLCHYFIKSICKKILFSYFHKIFHRCSVTKGAVKTLANFTGEHLC